MSVFRKEPVEVEYQLFFTDDGYEVLREGAHYDLIPYELVRIYVDEQTLLDSWFGGEFAYQTEALPPNVEN